MRKAHPDDLVESRLEAVEYLGGLGLAVGGGVLQTYVADIGDAMAMSGLLILIWYGIRMGERLGLQVFPRGWDGVPFELMFPSTVWLAVRVLLRRNT